jgi:hypothetical protein
MAEHYSEILLCHEIAEALEEVPEWKELLSRAGDRNMELYLRAMKDLIADTSDHGHTRGSSTRRTRRLQPYNRAHGGIPEGHLSEMQKAYSAFSTNGDWSVIDEHAGQDTNGSDRRETPSWNCTMSVAGRMILRGRSGTSADNLTTSPDGRDRNKAKIFVPQQRMKLRKIMRLHNPKSSGVSGLPLVRPSPSRP